MTDKEKLAELYQLYEKQLYAIAMAVLHNHAQAEDAVSEAYYRVVRHIGMLGKPDSPQTRQYMIRTIRSTAISQYRKISANRSIFRILTIHRRTFRTGQIY